jgi:uncharacterized protein YjbI with pentapeptide repeats
MNTSEQYHQPVLEALRAFVRARTRDDTRIGDQSPANEIQVAALTVIGRRHLSETEKVGVNLAGADIHNASLVEAHLIRARLSADLSRAKLSVGNLIGARLSADLSRADLSRATLIRAHLNGAAT